MLLEPKMEMTVKVVTRPHPGVRTRVLVLVIVLITVLVIWRLGYGLPDAITLALGAGLAGAQVAQALSARHMLDA